MRLVRAEGEFRSPQQQTGSYATQSWCTGGGQRGRRRRPQKERRVGSGLRQRRRRACLAASAPASSVAGGGGGGLHAIIAPNSSPEESEELGEGTRERFSTIYDCGGRAGWGSAGQGGAGQLAQLRRAPLCTAWLLRRRRQLLGRRWGRDTLQPSPWPRTARCVSTPRCGQTDVGHTNIISPPLFYLDDIAV